MVETFILTSDLLPLPYLAPHYGVSFEREIRAFHKPTLFRLTSMLSYLTTVSIGINFKYDAS